MPTSSIDSKYEFFYKDYPGIVYPIPTHPVNRLAEVTITTEPSIQDLHDIDYKIEYPFHITTYIEVSLPDNYFFDINYMILEGKVLNFKQHRCSHTFILDFDIADNKNLSIGVDVQFWISGVNYVKLPIKEFVKEFVIVEEGQVLNPGRWTIDPDTLEEYIMDPYWYTPTDNMKPKTLSGKIIYSEYMKFEIPYYVPFITSLVGGVPPFTYVWGVESLPNEEKPNQSMGEGMWYADKNLCSVVFKTYQRWYRVSCIVEDSVGQVLELTRDIFTEPSEFQKYYHFDMKERPPIYDALKVIDPVYKPIEIIPFYKNNYFSINSHIKPVFPDDFEPEDILAYLEEIENLITVDTVRAIWHMYEVDPIKMPLGVSSRAGIYYPYFFKMFNLYIDAEGFVNYYIGVRNDHPVTTAVNRITDAINIASIRNNIRLIFPRGNYPNGRFGEIDIAAQFYHTKTVEDVKQYVVDRAAQMYSSYEPENIFERVQADVRMYMQKELEFIEGTHSKIAGIV
jgi:hypothetical protein